MLTGPKFFVSLLAAALSANESACLSVQMGLVRMSYGSEAEWILQPAFQGATKKLVIAHMCLAHALTLSLASKTRATEGKEAIALPQIH